jgi:hypothetical protein
MLRRRIKRRPLSVWSSVSFAVVAANIPDTRKPSKGYKDMGGGINEKTRPETDELFFIPHPSSFILS